MTSENLPENLSPGEAVSEPLPLTAIQRLGIFMMKHLESDLDYDLDEHLRPSVLQTAYDLLTKVDPAMSREDIARELGMYSVVDVSALESSIIARLRRSSDSLANSEEFQLIEEAINAEHELLADAEPFRTAPTLPDIPDPPAATPSKQRSRRAAKPRKTRSAAPKQGRIAPPTTTPPEKTNSGQGGYYREAIQQINSVLTRRDDIDAADILPPKLLQTYMLLVDEDKSSRQIREELGVTIAYFSNRKQRIFDLLTKKASHVLGFPGIENKASTPPPPPKPPPSPKRSPSKSTAPEGAVGAQLTALLQEKYPKGRTGVVDQLAEEWGVSSQALWRFLGGGSHPSASKVLLPLLDFLNVPPDERVEIEAAYKQERRVKLSNHRWSKR